MRHRAAFPLTFLFAAGCASAPPPEKAPAAPAAGKAPFSAPAATGHEIRISVDTRAAREILGALSRPRFEPSDVKVLEDMLPVKLAIQDSGRSEEVFQRDFRAAFDPEVKTAVFDFAAIRNERDRWAVVLDSLNSRREDLERTCAARAASILPGDRAVKAKLAVYITFGLAGLADHMVVTTPDGSPGMLIDLARVLGESSPEPSNDQVSRLVRLISSEAFRQAWVIYRRESPAWSRPIAALGALEPLVRVTAETGPIALFGIEDSFYPLATWLKEPMQRSVNDLNRMGERVLESENDLEVRMSLTGELKRPDFARRVAAPAGASMADGIAQSFGLDALRGALAAGPLAFFQAYERAAQKDRDLTPLVKAIQARIAAASAPAPH